MVEISITLTPDNSLRVNRASILSTLRVLVVDEIARSSFLQVCGTTLQENWAINFEPTLGLRIDEESVVHLIKRKVDQRIEESEFLSNCGVRIDLKKQMDEI